MNYSTLPIVITFLMYGAVIYLIAFWSTRHTKNISDYLLAGRSLSGPVTALGAGASDMSAWLLMALPGGVYLYGLSVIWMPVALSIGAFVNWTFVSKRLRVYTEIANDSLTLPEYIDNRFMVSNKSLRVVTSLAIIIFFTMYSVSGFVSGGRLIEMIFGMAYGKALIISALVIIVYTAIGGFLAINRVDFFQGILMFTALLTVPCVAFIDLGGVKTTFLNIDLINPKFLNAFANVKVLGIISLFAWGFGYFGQPHILARFMAIRSFKELPIAKRICMSWMVLSLIGAILTGLVGIKYYLTNPLDNHETVFMALSRDLFNPWLTGILLSAILSAIMSTVSALILMSGSVLVEDFYRSFLRKHGTNKEYLWVSRLSVALIALVAVYIASNPELTVLSSVAFAWSGLGASFGPVILFSLYWRKVTRKGAITGIVVGGSTVILWAVLKKYVGGFFAHPDIIPGFSGLPGFILSSLSIVIVSLLTAKKPDAKSDAKLDVEDESRREKIEQQFDNMISIISKSSSK